MSALAVSSTPLDLSSSPAARATPTSDSDAFAAELKSASAGTSPSAAPTQDAQPRDPQLHDAPAVTTPGSTVAGGTAIAATSPETAAPAQAGERHERRHSAAEATPGISSPPAALAVAAAAGGGVAVVVGGGVAGGVAPADALAVSVVDAPPAPVPADAAPDAAPDATSTTADAAAVVAQSGGTSPAPAAPTPSLPAPSSAVASSVVASSAVASSAVASSAAVGSPPQVPLRGAGSAVSRPADGATTAPTVVRSLAPASAAPVSAVSVPPAAASPADSKPAAGAKSDARAADSPAHPGVFTLTPTSTVSAGTPVVPPPTAPSAPAPSPSPAAPASEAPLNAQLAPALFNLRGAASGSHVLTLTVSPDAIGPVTVRAHVAGDGIRIELSAPTDQGRHALDAMLPELRRDLSQGGMNSTLTLAAANADGSAGARPDFASAGGFSSRDGRQNAPIATPPDPRDSSPLPAGFSTIQRSRLTALDVLA